MTCSGDPGAAFEFITRPVVYPRQPFQLASGELLTYESRFFSMPAYSLLADKRLFTEEDDHPIADGDIKLYINKTAGVAPTIEPTIAGDEYLAGTPNYVDYIIDLRTLLVEVANLHAADSDWRPVDFFHAYMKRARATYPGDPCCGADLDNSSASDIPLGAFVHPTPDNVVPSGATPPGSSGSVPPPGDGFELGAQQIMDVDMDEIQYSPIVRPSKKNTTLFGLQSLPTGPVFPPVITAAGATPVFNSLDKNTLNDLALGVHASGNGLLVTGDALVGGNQIRNTSAPTSLDLSDPSVKFLTGSGQSIAAQGLFQQVIPWALYPAQKELCSYYTPEVAINTINASGRQAIFGVPTLSYDNNTVLLLNVSEENTSGSTVSNWPPNYYATSGIDANGHAHDGIHVCNKLIFNLNGNPALGFSPVNGQLLISHQHGTAVGSKGETWGGAGPKYANGDVLYAPGAVVLPFDGTDFSTINWATTNNRFAPVSWASVRTSALGPARGIFGAPDSVTFGIGDIIAGSSRGIITYKQYARWGFIDQLVVTDQDRALGGQRARETISYTTREYREGKKDDGSFVWEEVENSPSNHASQFVYYRDTYFVNNIVSFFFKKKFNNGFVHVNGDVYQQWSQKILGQDVIPRGELFAPIGQPTFRQVPTRTRTDVIISIGFFPNWARRRYVTTNNQVTVPDQVEFSPAKSKFITLDSDMFDTPEAQTTFCSGIDTYGRPVWDPAEGVNYLYFLWADAEENQTKLFFAHMDTDFVIFRMNQVDLGGGAGLLFGKPALLSI